MEIIEIRIIREIPHGTEFRTYCAEPFPEAAVQVDRQKCGSDPKFVYHKILASGRSTVYIPITPVRPVICSQVVKQEQNE